MIRGCNGALHRLSGHRGYSDMKRTIVLRMEGQEKFCSRMRGKKKYVAVRGYLPLRRRKGRREPKEEVLAGVR